MELKSSYILLKNPYIRGKKTDDYFENRAAALAANNTLDCLIKASFPKIVRVDDWGSFYKRKYATDLPCGSVTCRVEFIITEVVDTKYLDIVAMGSSKKQIAECMEDIQQKFFSSCVRERYIDIISYDAVSEYYCNKIYPKLNTLERNLRKLLFNIYVVNFGLNYYKATINEGLQNKAKQVVNRDSRKKEKDHIKEKYTATTRKEVEEIELLQRFFYSLEYGDIQDLLFTPTWTSTDEAEKLAFLSEHKNLSDLSNEKLREAFSRYVPRSDWERFFSSKIQIPDIKESFEQIRLCRNSVAHCKFFYKEEYDKCNVLVNRLNAAIIKAIRITEDKDFANKNAESLSKALDVFSNRFAMFSKSFMEVASKTFTDVIIPALTLAQESIATESLSDFKTNAAPPSEER